MDTDLQERAWADTELDTHTITAVAAEQRDGVVTGWSVKRDDGWSTWISAEYGVEPHVGDTITLWGKGIGYTFRGQALGARVLWYRSAVERRADEAAEQAAHDAAARATYAANLFDHDVRIAALPEPFQRRIAWFRAGSPDWGWKNEAYELFACEQAVAFATCFPTVERLQEFKDLTYAEQRAACPAMAEGHSGGTFAAARSLARVFIEQPDLVWKWHGAMCPLVGCHAYGCYAVRKDNERVS